MKISTRLILTFLLISIIPVAVFSAIFVNATEDALRNSIGGDFKHHAYEKADAIAIILNERIAEARVLAGMAEVRNAVRGSNLSYAGKINDEISESINRIDREWIKSEGESETAGEILDSELSRFLRGYQGKEKTKYGEIFVTDIKGATVAMTKTLTDYYQADEGWWEFAFNKGRGKVFIDDRGYDTSIEVLVVGIVVPIVDDGRAIGILKMNYRVSPILNIVSSFHGMPGETETFLARSQGDVISHVEEGRSREKLSLREKEIMLSNTGGWIQDIHAGKHSIMGYAPIDVEIFRRVPTAGEIKGVSGEKWEPTTWFMFLELEEGKAFVSIFAIKKAAIFMVSIMAAVLLVLARFFGKRISEPIRKLTKGAEIIGSGNLNYKVGTDRADEIGQLSRAFDLMTENLMKTTTSVDNLNKEMDERKKAEEALQRSNRALRTVSDCNQALIRASDEEQLLKDICRIIIGVGGYRFVWVGFAENDEEKSVKPVAFEGFEDGYLDKLGITWADSERGRGPTGRAIRTGKSQITRDIPTDPDFGPWRDEAVKRGFASSAALPLINEGRTFGSLNIYASEAEAFDKEEVNLLQELVDDVSYGIHTIRLRVEYQKAEEAIRHGFDIEWALEQASRLFFTPGEPDLTKFLEYLGRAVQANRAHIFRYRQHESRMDNTNEWCDENTSSQMANLQNLDSLLVPWWTEKMHKGETILIPDVDSMPEEAQSERDFLKSQDIKSLLSVPIKSLSGGLHGFIGFDDTVSKRKWREEDIRILEMAGEMLSSYFERKRTERNMRESELKYRSVTQTASDAIISADKDGNVTSWNDGATAVFGYDEEEMLGKTLTNLMPERFRKAHKEGMSRFESTGKSKVIGKRIELVGQRKNGTEFPLELSISSWKTVEGIFFSGIIHDITERKRAEEELHKSNKELKDTLGQLKKAQNLLVRSEKLISMGTLSAGVAHEILNPLNIISTIVQVLKLEDDLTDDFRENLDEIINMVNRATKITNNLRMFAHRKRAEMKPLDIHTLFDKTATLIEHDLNLDNIQIERNFDDNLPIINADEDEIAQVFLNLLNNAKDAMKGGKHNLIKIKSEAKDGIIEIRFSDTGPGIPKEIINQIFDPFFTTKDPDKGTGLGLSLLHSIIERHDGTIGVESNEGEGATFIITLPVTPSSET